MPTVGRTGTRDKITQGTACGTQDAWVASPDVHMVWGECQVIKCVGRVIIAHPSVLFALVSTPDTLFA
jgi:hypothetical protein